MIDALSQGLVGQDTAVTYFYCDYANHNTLEASVILGTIIQQLLAVRPSIEEVIAVKIRETFDHGFNFSSIGDLSDILESVILKYHQRVYILIDGLDEANPDTQGRVLSNLARLSTSCGTHLRLCISTREIILRSSDFPTCLSLNISENRVTEDIEHYIKASVQQRLHSLPIILAHPYLEQNAFHELKAKAQGL